MLELLANPKGRCVDLRLWRARYLRRVPEWSERGYRGNGGKSGFCDFHHTAKPTAFVVSGLETGVGFTERRASQGEECDDVD
jgi:hypothetical protein